ncbi:MAG: ABC transporter substrate-binding protein [Gammaproteobacteria bacterium]|nr:ABC transporter substrate-binding protein [Gammaproteobacteria bacterium]
MTEHDLKYQKKLGVSGLLWWVGAVFIIQAVSISVQAAGDFDNPRRLVSVATDQLVTSLQHHSETITTDTQLAHQIADDAVIRHVDFGKVSRLVLGKHWRRASLAQRSRFGDEFRKYLTRVYVSAMIVYSEDIVSHADAIDYLSVRYTENGTAAVVRSRLSLRTGQDVAVDYRLHKNDDAWKIFDVIIEGVSLVTTYRSSIAAEIAQNGLDNVINALAQKTQ